MLPFEYNSPLAERLRAEGRAEGEARVKAEGRAKGEARGKAESILRVLDTRGVALSRTTREHVQACTDLDQLDHWLTSALAALTCPVLHDEDTFLNG